MRLWSTFALTLILTFPVSLFGRGGGVSMHDWYYHRGASTIKRSASARRAFVKTHPCPASGKTTGPCHGYVVDHVVPLKRGGPDSPGNMQWQTKAAAKLKDKTE